MSSLHNHVTLSIEDSLAVSISIWLNGIRISFKCGAERSHKVYLSPQRNVSIVLKKHIQHSPDWCQKFRTDLHTLYHWRWCSEGKIYSTSFSTCADIMEIFCPIITLWIDNIVFIIWGSHVGYINLNMDVNFSNPDKCVMFPAFRVILRSNECHMTSLMTSRYVSNNVIRHHITVVLMPHDVTDPGRILCRP